MGSFLFSLIRNFAPRFLQVRRGTWIAIGLGVLTLVALLVWATIALLGWFFGQAQGLIGNAPDVARGAIGQVEQVAPGVSAQIEQVAPGVSAQIEQVVPGVRERIEQVVPGVREQLGAWVPALKPEPPPRDVSGTDIGPVERYPGLARSHWHREGREVTVRYEGTAAYTAVLDHYVRGFAAQGYAQTVLSAAPEGERHDYVKGAERVGFALEQLPGGRVKATVIAVLPAVTQ